MNPTHMQFGINSVSSLASDTGIHNFLLCDVIDIDLIMQHASSRRGHGPWYAPGPNDIAPQTLTIPIEIVA